MIRSIPLSKPEISCVMSRKALYFKPNNATPVFNVKTVTTEPNFSRQIHAVALPAAPLPGLNAMALRDVLMTEMKRQQSPCTLSLQVGHGFGCRHPIRLIK